MSGLPPSSPPLPARAIPRGKAAHALYGTEHITSWKTIFFFVLLFIAFWIFIHLRPLL